ncbi:MAG: chemotaxis protein CheX [Fimbriimonadaceae bacterium]
MDVKLINPFIMATFSVYEMVLGEMPTKGQLGIQSTCSTVSDINVVLGLTGDVTGTIVFGMCQQTALKIASKMTFQDLKILDPLAKSAIAELCNMVSGNALQDLSDQGFVCDITPPSLIKGSNVEINLMASPALRLPVQTSLGEVLVTVALSEQSKAQAA